MSYFTFPIPSQPQQHHILANALKGADSLAIAHIAEKHQGMVCVVTPDNQTARQLHHILQHLLKKSVLFFPDYETLPYDHFSPQQEIISERLRTLFTLQQQSQGVVILSVSTLMQRLCPQTFLQQNVLLLEKGERLNATLFRENLIQAGYVSVDQVLSHGEFACRGGIFDLFPMGAETPYRLDFFDDEIESIRTFDVDSQRTIAEKDRICLLPAHEFPINETGIEHFRTHFRRIFPEIRRDPEHIYQQISQGIRVAGIEYWQPLFFDEMASLFDYLPPHTLFIDWQHNDQKGEQFLQDANARYESRKVDPMRPLLPVQQLWLPVDELYRRFRNYPRLTLRYEAPSREKANIHTLPVSSLPDIALRPQEKYPLRPLERFLQQFQGKVIFVAETAGRREALQDLLKGLNRPLAIIQDWQQVEDDALWVNPLDKGVIFHTTPPLALITEQELLGEKVQNRRPRTKTLNPDTLIRNLAELKIGQAVVHLDHGIGRYLGLTLIENAGVEAEFFVLEYANGAKLYVPVANLHLISRYVGGNDEHVQVHKLGNGEWAKTRAKAMEKIRDVAAELLDIYAKRNVKKGLAFHYDREAYQAFSARFPFEETEDQKNAIHAVISDMCQPKAMDRLICGDVGFGKTEVAIRASFLAVMNNKQVAVLVPTTLLAKQHFETWRDRFADLPVNIAMLSRFNASKADKQIREEIKTGKVDILIGTHKLLQNDVQFKDLGLLIIDEEHRFGVQQKEKIKTLRAEVDILTLTATPIPRTLNMAMHSIRDLSIISTPPARRLSVKTFVRQNDPHLVREAILREISRGGQVYYLHNDVASIENCAENLSQLVPEARIGIGHGQMHKRQLERVMTDFHHQRFNLLVCSTIIETGIDIPTANTIIIERADKFGLAQLHQLRGRVGRSHHQAYAYLLTPPPKSLTKDAQKRLEALENLDTLGAGFLLATQDLEIRGAGELLGADQSGQIESIGFGLYMDLLEEAVNALKTGNNIALTDLTQHQTDIDLHLPALIPDSYLGDVAMRLAFYKRIASSEHPQTLQELKAELIDRFGSLPPPLQNLLRMAELRLSLRHKGVKRLVAHAQGGFIELSENTHIDPMKCLTLIQEHPEIYAFEGQYKFKFKTDLTDVSHRWHVIEQLIAHLFH